MFTKTTKYAIRILFFMANDNKKVYSTKYLQEKLKIPMKYLCKLMTDLSKKGLVKSIQGRGGGFILAKDPSKIFLSDIIDATEGMKKFDECILGFEDCKDNNPCALHNIWTEIKRTLIPILKTTSLKDLKENKVVRF